MSRRGANGVRGPASALTSYLREQNINTGPMHMYSRRQAPAPAAPAAEATEETPAETPGAGPSSASAGLSSPPEAPRKRKRREAQDDNDDDDEALDSDNLDDDDDDEPPPKAVKGKKQALPTKAATAKAKAAAKKKAKKDGTYRSDDDDEEDDEYKAPSKMMTAPRPPIGSMEPCAKCGKKFPMTKYTQAASPPPGYLCHNCTKAAGIDPFKKTTAPRQKRKAEDKRKIVNFEEKDITSLTHHCISVITQHIEDVEALGSIGIDNMNEICKIICRNRKLTRENAMLFFDVDNTSLSLYDCSLLDGKALSSLAPLNPNVQSLRLEYCGRMTDAVLTGWSSQLTSLHSLDLLGPFNVKAEAWISFLENASNPLERFAITQSPRFDIKCLQALLTHHGASLTSLRLKEIGKLNDSWLGKLSELSQLISLDISRPTHSASDDALIELLSTIGKNLTHLDITGHEELTHRVFLEGIGPHCAKLVSLAAADLPLLVDEGVAVFFGATLEPPDERDATRADPDVNQDEDAEMEDGENVANNNHAEDEEGNTDDGPLVVKAEINPPPPSVLPSLQSLDLSRAPLLGTSSLDALLRHSGSTLHTLNINQWKSASNESLLKIGKAAPKLTEVNLGWCREVDNFVVKELLNECKALKVILVSGCNRLTSDCPRKVCRSSAFLFSE
ncbi:RNI-like protein [Clavulina sp. PMI_390]|nr:RNI-like protein [Clavulina sp. PMI_390]